MAQPCVIKPETPAVDTDGNSPHRKTADKQYSAGRPKPDDQECHRKQDETRSDRHAVVPPPHDRQLPLHLRWKRCAHERMTPNETKISYWRRLARWLLRSQRDSRSQLAASPWLGHWGWFLEMLELKLNGWHRERDSRGDEIWRSLNEPYPCTRECALMLTRQCNSCQKAKAEHDT